MTVDEYFRFEERSEIRHEYVAGEVYAMTGGTARHDRIARNVARRLDLAAGDGPCEVFTYNMRLELASDVYYYPDVMVACGPIADLDVVVRDPCAVVEVTSPSTGRLDRGEKVENYRRVRALRAYLIVDHRRRRVERHWRDVPDGEWRRDEGVAEGRVTIPCLDVELELDEIYRRVALPAVGEPEAEYVQSEAGWEPVDEY